MRHHDNPTDTQYHIAHDHEASLGSTTPLRTPSHTSRNHFWLSSRISQTKRSVLRVSQNRCSQERPSEKAPVTWFPEDPQHKETPHLQFSSTSSSTMPLTVATFWLFTLADMSWQSAKVADAEGNGFHPLNSVSNNSLS